MQPPQTPKCGQGGWPAPAGLQKVEQAGGDAVAARLIHPDADTVTGNGRGNIDPPPAVIRQTAAAGADFSDGEFDGAADGGFALRWGRLAIGSAGQLRSGGRESAGISAERRAAVSNSTQTTSLVAMQVSPWKTAPARSGTSGRTESPSTPTPQGAGIVHSDRKSMTIRAITTDSGPVTGVAGVTEQRHPRALEIGADRGVIDVAQRVQVGEADRPRRSSRGRIPGW